MLALADRLRSICQEATKGTFQCPFDQQRVIASATKECHRLLFVADEDRARELNRIEADSRIDHSSVLKDIDIQRDIVITGTGPKLQRRSRTTSITTDQVIAIACIDRQKVYRRDISQANRIVGIAGDLPR
jgi:hypothetical protein